MSRIFAATISYIKQLAQCRYTNTMYGDNITKIPLMTRLQNKMASRLQNKMASMMNKYAIARRAILIFLMYIIYEIMTTILEVYREKYIVAPEMVDIVALFVAILTIFSCFYTASRLSEVTTTETKVDIADSTNGENEEEPLDR